jgi:excisionase family DNA binding protein
MEKLLKVEEVAKMIAMSRSKTYALIKEGAFPVVRLGPQTIRVRPEDIRAWIATLPYSGPEELRPRADEEGSDARIQ